MDVKGRNFIKFLEREKAFEKQNSQEVVDKQHSRGKLTARERIQIVERAFEKYLNELEGSLKTHEERPTEGKRNLSQEMNK